MANTRSDIITNLDTRLKTILTAGGYQSNIGSKVYNYITYDISDSDLPCIVYRDPEIIPLTAIQSQIVTCDYLLNVEITKVEASELIALQAISRRTFEEAFSADNSEEDMSLYLRDSLSIEQLTKEIEDQHSAFYFAKVEDEIAAYLKVNYHTHFQCHKLHKHLYIQDYQKQTKLLYG
jgi:hypothetical protein